MDRTLLSWNLPNWITVLLMAGAGYVVLALVSQVFVQKGPSQTSTGAGGF